MTPALPQQVVVSRRLGILRISALELFAALAPVGDGALFESLTGTGAPSRYSYVIARPRSVVTRSVEELQASKTDPFDLLRTHARSLQRGPTDDDAVPPFVGGAVAVLGYECAAIVEQMRVPAHDPVGAPAVAILETGVVIGVDETTREAVAYLLVDAEDEGARRRAELALDEIVAEVEAADAAAQPPVPATSELAAATPRAEHEAYAQVTHTEFADRVTALNFHIRAGDVIQTVLARRWTIPCPASDLSLYRELRTRNPSPHMALVRTGSTSLIAASPELLLEAHHGQASTSPIAGTRPRGSTRAIDREHAASLRNDPKERAEHLMLVDLARNDLNRVCTPGTVRVPRYMRTERFAHVMHLTSHVVGELAGDGIDALRSVFPAGTVSGAPKLRAMELISDFEDERRGPYAGALVLAGADGMVEAAITLRSIVLHDGRAHVHAGAGIVAASTPLGEADETASKASAALDAVLAAREGR